MCLRASYGPHSVSKTAVLGRGLHRMARRAQRLPVASAPEQRFVTFVWDNVVNHGRCRQAARLLAFPAQRELRQKRRACLPPAVCVATLLGRAAPRIGFAGALLGVRLAEPWRVDQLAAAGVSANGLGSCRHHQPQEKERAGPEGPALSTLVKGEETLMAMRAMTTIKTPVPHELPLRVVLFIVVML